LTATSAAVAGSAAYAIPGAGTAPGTNVGASLALSRTEAAASIGIRTQTIQLLRDGLYRACEAYMNGAIDQFQYNIILTNVHKLTQTLLGIDAIGGTQKAPAVAVYAGGSKITTGAGAEGKQGTSAEIEEDAGSPPKSGEGTGTAHMVIAPEKGAQAAGDVQAEAIANIVLAANAQSSMPALCVSLLASGEMRLDNPGQNSVMKSCDYLLHGAVRNFVRHGPQPVPSSYRMSQQK
jgi:hypothetical protein